MEICSSIEDSNLSIILTKKTTKSPGITIINVIHTKRRSI